MMYGTAALIMNSYKYLLMIFNYSQLTSAALISMFTQRVTHSYSNRFYRFYGK